MKKVVLILAPISALVDGWAFDALQIPENGDPVRLENDTLLKIVPSAHVSSGVIKSAYIQTGDLLPALVKLEKHADSIVPGGRGDMLVNLTFSDNEL